jgi:hypothetical protein
MIEIEKVDTEFVRQVWILNCFEHTDEPPGKPRDLLNP